MVRGVVGRNQYDRLRTRLACVRLLRILKRHMKYRDMMRETKLSPTVLNRYCLGKIIPHQSRAEELYAMILKNIRRYVPFKPETNDIELLNVYADLALEKLIGLRVTKVLTSEFDNVPFATLVADRVSKPIIIASTRMRDMENICVPIQFSLNRYEPLFVPKKAIKRSDSVLIVSNLTHVRQTLMRICLKARADITGYLVIEENGVFFHVL